MADLTPSLLPILKSHRLPGLDFGEGMIYPKYDGNSILNIPSGICRLLGVPGLDSPPLAEELLKALSR